MVWCIVNKGMEWAVYWYILYWGMGCGVVWCIVKKGMECFLGVFFREAIK